MTPKASWAACAAILVALGGTVGVAESKPALTMKLSAYMSPAQSDVIVRARVEPDARSRELTIEWVADDLSGGLHSIPLEGARAPVAHDYRLKRMSPGQYVVTAVLRLSDGKEVRKALNLIVVGEDGSDGLDAMATGGSAAGRARRGRRD